MRTVKGKKKLSFDTFARAALPSVPGLLIDEEEKALVEFIMLSTDGKNWPRSSVVSNPTFWDSAATFIAQRCRVSQRTG